MFVLSSKLRRQMPVDCHNSLSVLRNLSRSSISATASPHEATRVRPLLWAFTGMSAQYRGCFLSLRVSRTHIQGGYTRQLRSVANFYVVVSCVLLAVTPLSSLSSS